MSTQLTLFDYGEPPKRKGVTSTFSDNLSLPINRWFRYSAGFSAPWVRDLIDKEKANGRQRIFDPFTGSGTVLLEGEACEVQAMGVEAHPFVVRVAQAKLYWREDPKAFRDYARSVLECAKKLGVDERCYSPLIEKCFPPGVRARLNSLRKGWEANADNSPFSELVWLAMVSILRECSPVGTAQWQYVLPKKTKAKYLDPYEAFLAKVDLMSQDMSARQRQDYGPQALLYRGDARGCSSVPESWADLVITSPPYANNYDYADATRLEMSFLGEVYGWGDLQDAVRKHLVRSCTQHVSKISKETGKMLEDPLLEPIRREISEVCNRLELERKEHGGKKPYHSMVVAYFSDMAKVWRALRRATQRDALVCFVVGDSAPYGIYVPVDRWLGELAIAAGFESYTFEKVRDRNVKWKNRKHRVPLHEGHLWVKG